MSAAQGVPALAAVPGPHRVDCGMGDVVLGDGTRVPCEAVSRVSGSLYEVRESRGLDGVMREAHLPTADRCLEVEDGRRFRLEFCWPRDACEFESALQTCQACPAVVERRERAQYERLRQKFGGGEGQA